VTLWCSFMKHDGCQRGTWGGTSGGYKDYEGYGGYGGYGEYAWGVVSGVPGLGTHLRNTIEHDSIYTEWSDSISDCWDSSTGSTGDSISSNSSQDSKDIVMTMPISSTTQESNNCHKKLQRTAGNNAKAIKQRTTSSGVKDVLSYKVGKHQTLRVRPSEHLDWHSENLRLSVSVSEHQKLFSRASEHQKLTERASEPQRLFNRTNKHQKLSERASEHQQLFRMTNEHQKLYKLAIEHQKLYERANSHQELKAKPDKHQKLSPRFSEHHELPASVGEHPKLSRTKGVEVCRRCGEPEPGFPAKKTISEIKDDTYSYAYSDTMSPADLIRLGKNGEYSEDSSIVSSTDSNIYEVIEQATPECSEQGSLYLNISRGRRDHLKQHRGVGWDCGGGQGQVGHWDCGDGQGQVGHSILLKMISQNSTNQDTLKHDIAFNHQDSEAGFLKKKEILQTNRPETHETERRNSLEKSKSLINKKSLSKTLSSIIVSIRKLF